MSDENSELRSGDQVLYGDLLDGHKRTVLLDRGAFSEAIRGTSRIVIACCPPADIDSDLEFSLALQYIRQTQVVADTIHVSELIRRCEAPDVSLTPM